MDDTPNTNKNAEENPSKTQDVRVDPALLNAQKAQEDVEEKTGILRNFFNGILGKK